MKATREIRPVNEVILEYWQAVMDRIRNWDIRRSQTLIDLFTDKGQRIRLSKFDRIEYNEHGD